MNFFDTSLFDALCLLVALVAIVAAAELFTNGVEWLGQRLQLSEGVVGSVLAAVGTALPETLIPFVAVIFFGQKEGGVDVGIGAIAGAPFMLSTLTLGLCGLTVVLMSKAGKRSGELNVNRVVIARDLKFFIGAYTIAMLATLATDLEMVRWLIAICLCLIYPVYVVKTFTHEGEVGEAPDSLHLDRILKMGSNRLMLIVPQIVLGLAGIIGGAFIFVDHCDDLAHDLGFHPLVLSLIISPIATELPEKINSILWARAGKDTLAVANISGALVFQSCFPAAFGIAFTKWDLTTGTILTGVVAISSAIAYLTLLQTNRLKPYHLLCGIFCYIAAVSGLIHLASANIIEAPTH